MTTNMKTILADFGNFASNVNYNQFGVFYNDSVGDCQQIEIYQGTNCGIYWEFQCKTHKFNRCPVIDKCTSKDRDRDSMIKFLLSKKYKYILNSNYFDDSGNNKY